jgi:hypothetical protein
VRRVRKRIQEDRQKAGATVMCWATNRGGVSFCDDAREKLLDGFGRSESGEDPFDALLGLLSMIDVVDGKRDEGSTSVADLITWEGWILGQRPPVSSR